jgi:hypothetical protein
MDGCSVHRCERLPDGDSDRDLSFRVYASIHMSGEQREDRVYLGTTCTADIEAVVFWEDGVWQLGEYEIVGVQPEPLHEDEAWAEEQAAQMFDELEPE